jgi:cyclopropane fatty-acyl-phospholipid synthase-like methyltransferase
MDKSMRFTWAADMMNVQPTDKILEIGCGVGLAIEAIAPALKTGKITAIDKSRTMIEKALRRNYRQVKEKKVELYALDLGKARMKPRSYTKVFAFNVNLFWTKEALTREMNLIRSWMTPSGELYLFYQPPSMSGIKKISALIARNMGSEKFSIGNTMYNEEMGCVCFMVMPVKEKRG